MNAMVTVIAKKELGALFREGRFRLTAGVLILLLAVSFVISFQNHRASNAERAKAQASSRQNWITQEPKNPHRAAHFGNFAFRLKTPLSLFDNGLDNYTGTSIYLEPHKSDDFQFSAAEESTALLRFGELTPAFVLQSILSLLVIFLFFDAVSKEREEGTLKLLLSQGASSQSLITGKVLGYWSGLMLLVIPLFIITALVLPAQPQVDQGDLWMRYITLAVVYALYTAIVVSISVVVSARSDTSRGSLMKLLGLWMLACIVVPKVAGIAGGILHKTPSQYEYAQLVKHDEEAGLDGHDPNDKRREVLVQKVLKQYGVDTVTALPVNFDAIAMTEGERYTTAIYRKRIGEVRTIFNQQNSLTDFTGFINPFQAVVSTSRTLAGTDYPQFTRFQDGAENYRLYFVNTMNEFMTTHTKSGDWSTPFGSETYQLIKPFAYSEPCIGWAAMEGWTGIAALLFWAAVSGLLIVRTKLNVV